MSRAKEHLNLSENVAVVTSIKSTEGGFFLKQPVKTSSGRDVKTIFKTLLLQKKCKQQDLADYCAVSKSYISPVVNAKYIPDLRMRLKIASFFNVDTTLIWNIPNIVSADKIQGKPDVNLAEASILKRVGGSNE